MCAKNPHHQQVSVYRKQITGLPSRTTLTFVEDDRANYVGLATVHLIKPGEHNKNLF